MCTGRVIWITATTMNTLNVVSQWGAIAALARKGTNEIEPVAVLAKVKVNNCVNKAIAPRHNTAAPKLLLNAGARIYNIAAAHIAAVKVEAI